ncbi:MAG: pyridoxal phosphate-dependent aminotransferase [Candidatus Omnitrophota bacterium]
MKLSNRIDDVKPSATLSITSRAKSLVKEGEGVVIFAAGEPDFDTPKIVKEAAIKAIREGVTKYTPAGGTATLKEAIVHKLSNDNDLKYSADEVVISAGAKHSLYNLFQVILDQGDEVLIIHPYWLSYPEMVKLAGGVPRFLQTSRENGFKARAEDIRSALTEKTRAIIINSPSNPAGVVYEKEELEEIAEVCLAEDVMVVSDEIYEKIIFGGKKHFSIAAVSDRLRERTVVVNGVSKSYAMTGWRIGYMAAQKDIVKAVTTLQSHSTSNPCSISQAAAECALKSDLDKLMNANRKEFEKRRDVLIENLSSEERIVPFKPSGAFYLFCDISQFGMDSMTFSKKLLEEKQVAVIPGGPFGDDRYVRMSFATDLKTIKEGTRRIKDWTSKL